MQIYYLYLYVFIYIFYLIPLCYSVTNIVKQSASNCTKVLKILWILIVSSTFYYVLHNYGEHARRLCGYFILIPIQIQISIQSKPACLPLPFPSLLFQSL